MRLTLLPRLLVAVVLALAALALAAGLRPEGAKAAPVVCAEVHRYPSGSPVIPWRCVGLGGVSEPCLHHADFGPLLGYSGSYCVDVL